MIKGLEDLTYVERVTELGLLSHEERRLRGILYTCIKIPDGGVKKIELVSSWGTNCNTENSI